LGHLGLLDDIRWLFAWGGEGHFIEMKEHAYRDLTLEFMSTLYVKVTQGFNVNRDIFHFICKRRFMS